MLRYIAGGAGAVLLVVAGFFLWTSRAQNQSVIPAAPGAAVAGPAAEDNDDEGEASANVAPPAADERTREQKRFDRADKDRNGKVTLAEMLEPRRKAFAKLDTNGDGRLSFEEWTIKTSDKFAEADKDRNGALIPAEFATTKPKRSAKPKCSC